MSAYQFYRREDELCQTNGHFSLNLRKSAVPEIERLLGLVPGARVGWVGCGDGREVISLAMSHRDVVFDAFEINPHAMEIARRVAREAGVENVSFFGHAFEEVTPDRTFSHIYSTAIAGPQLYARLYAAAEQKLCVLRSMWLPEWDSRDVTVATVRLAGSGEQRQLWCARKGE